MKEFITMQEAAILLDVNPVTVRRYCEQGKLSYYQIGSRKRFVKEDIENYIERSKCHATAEQNPFDAS